MPDANVNETVGQLAAARQELKAVRGVLHWVTGILAFLSFAHLFPIHLPPDLLSRGVVILFSVSLGKQVSWWWEAREAKNLHISGLVSTQTPEAT